MTISKTHNLVFLTTPLQSKYFHQIFQGDIKDTRVIYAPLVDNAKQRYYCQLLEKFGFSVEYVVFRHIKQLKDLVESVSFVTHLYAASLDHLFVKELLDKFTACKLLSFDDGTINIALNQRFHRMIRTERITKHYTFFENRQNIVNDERLIYRSFKIDNYHITGKGECHIFLSQPLPGANLANYVKMEMTVKYPQITHHFPHPRLANSLFGLIDINTALIFEDYIRELFKEYDRLVVYTFCSTSEYLLKNIKNIQFVNLDKHNILHRKLGI